MSSTEGNQFGKARSCPSSEELVLSAGSKPIQYHVAGCEFCAAEKNFLSAYPLVNTNYEKPENMPEHLRILAESLLRGKSKSGITRG